MTEMQVCKIEVRSREIFGGVEVKLSGDVTAKWGHDKPVTTDFTTMTYPDVHIKL